jgi:hypothetical protein
MIALPTFRGALAGFNPLAFGPIMWLDANDRNTLYDATTGGALVAPDGAVARWEDKSGNSNHGTQATLARRAILKTNQQNGKNVIRFNGLTTPGNGTFFSHPWNETSEFTFFSAIKSGTAAHRHIFGAKSSGAITLIYQSANGPFATYNSIPAEIKATTSIASSWNVISLVKNTTLSLRTNRSLEYGPSSFTPYGGDTNNRRSIGGYANPSLEETFKDDIGEIIVYAKTLTTDQCLQVEQYLKKKWATP